MIKRKAYVPKNQCVACGCCVKVCPKGAVSIIKGLFAQVDKDLCVGCQKCKTECPASIIIMEDMSNEN